MQTGGQVRAQSGIEANRAQRRQVDGDEIKPSRSMTMRVVPSAIVVCVPQT